MSLDFEFSNENCYGYCYIVEPNKGHINLKRIAHDHISTDGIIAQCLHTIEHESLHQAIIPICGINDEYFIAKNEYIVYELMKDFTTNYDVGHLKIQKWKYYFYLALLIAYIVYIVWRLGIWGT